ncbi:alkene reductase [Paenibacillus prosopidis]|uniref:2,4-dienoyl-CoA reductase-like NADH-dependent reductase (Old Yellow Enzyme family) n=1 Tax=Paenibacillus prosopidis TaxID=630520 RepID=A0A368VUE2_9BACL|nr:alkene reductase [Paenibacillus prosopidis]RCW45485.1 2,4-dienoyl-CoA reductase-like NADH-dependent reductase (Old Yellow Enzyme family) [Paenibacillus prosopidis]
MEKLWSKTKIGKMELPHRLAMAPMTRGRAQEDGTPGEDASLYYAQRASMGLIITEGAQPSDDGQGYLWSPGIYTEKHIEGWRKVTDAVHGEGGYMYIQLMHAGRMSHPDNTPHHRQPVAPSSIAPGVEMFTATGMQDIPVPRELSKEDIQTTIADFRKAAAAAIAAGADGVEIHGANGYLINQFIGESSNTRTDEYGGSIENRARFAIEVARAIVDEIGAERTGFRISPGTPLGGIQDGEQGPELYRYLVQELAQLDLAYLHIMHLGNEELLRDIRSLWTNPLLVNRAGRALEDLSADIDSGLADLVPVGVWSLANPDLVERLQKGAPLNEADPATFFGHGSKGYTDYPTMNELASQER